MPVADADDRYERERLHRAAGEGDIAGIAHLISLGFDVNLFDEIGRTPLHYAVAAGQYDAVRSEPIRILADGWEIPRAAEPGAECGA